VRLFEYGAGFLAVSAVAFRNYFSSRSFKTRQQMKIVLVSCLIALVPLIIINVIPQAVWGSQSVFQAGFSILVIVFIPLGIGYAVVSQQLMDIDIIIRRGVIYGLITVIMASILGVAIFLVMILDKTMGIGVEIILALALGALATALFGPAKKHIEVIVDKYLYRDRYDYRMIIQNLSNFLRSFRDLNDISRLIVGTVVETLNLAGGALFVKTQSGVFEVGATQGVFNDPDIKSKLSRVIAVRQNRLDFPEGAFQSNPDVPYMIPLVASGKEVGILCVSRKKSRQDFSHDDLFLLQGITSVTAMAVSNAMLVRDVSLRNTFVSIASHELRTPLTSIVGFAQLLIQRDPVDERRIQWLKKIQESGKMLTAMVDDLLNITRIQSGRLTLKLGEVNLTRLIEEKLAVAREMTDKHEFIFEAGPDLPEALADRDKLGQVIDNLLSNAIKYSPLGGKITVSACRSPRQHRVIISVADRGIGISPEDKDSLFTTFHRIQRPETQSIRGSGLGLYIAKEWTVAMGGEIWLESQLNKGSTFYISLPAGEPDPEKITTEKIGMNDAEKNADS
ncbi:MAG: ATP-binding protein, partial [Dehalococcoidales bacterium]|nr:ATP-binding protein [Dehalococcoidales bacterium]